MPIPPHPSPAAPARTACCGARLTVYDCDPGEAAAFAELAPAFGVTPVLTEAVLSPGTADLARGARCVSVSHKTAVDADTLRALHRAGVRHLGTRSIGCDHRTPPSPGRPMPSAPPAIPGPGTRPWPTLSSNGPRERPAVSAG